MKKIILAISLLLNLQDAFPMEGPGTNPDITFEDVSAPNREIILAHLLYANPEAERQFMGELGIPSLPATARFTFEDHELRYIAVEHTNERESPTFRLIQQEIETFKPQFMILEGFCNNQIESLKSSCFQDGHLIEPTYTSWGEPLHSIFLALKNEIPFMSGEPLWQDEIDYLHKEKQFLMEDIAYYYLIRQVQQQWRNKAITQEEEARTFVNIGMGKPVDGYSYEGLKAWYEKTYEQPYSFEMMTTLNIASGSTGKLGQIATHSMYFRDIIILSRTISSMRAYGKVLLVYGGTHFYTQHKVLIHCFGQPTYVPFI